MFKMDNLQKKYGFWTATAMVVGIVIGSGVFFKADDVLKAAGGDLPTALIAWLIGGSIMVVTAYVFSKIATVSKRSTVWWIILKKLTAKKPATWSAGS